MIKLHPSLKIVALTALILHLATGHAISCSMFKITLHGKTMAGNNEDAWRINSKIWFEKGATGKYGAVYVGHTDMFPQGGMNEAGLIFDGFTVYPRQLKAVQGKKQVENPTSFIKELMQRCRSVEDVQRLASQFDRSIFNNGIFLFVDNTGKYLVMEADTLITGNDSKYVISNFCPSTIKNPDDVKIARYQKGRAFLENKADTSLSFCTSVMDTMHQCRNKIGDGTLYTIIYDSNEGLIYLYFYHDFTQVVKFDLREELAKGDHVLNIPGLFPENKEYLQFLHYLTPFNSVFLQLFLYFLALVFVCSVLYWVVCYFRKNYPQDINKQRRYTIVLFVLVNMMLLSYLYTLFSDQSIFYYEAPYSISGKYLLNVSAYIPIVLLLLIIPVTILNVKIIKQSFWMKITKGVFTLNTVFYCALLLLFAYWGLLNIIRF
ncbi:hypothetical protein [Chitinophaga sp. S165]|uniref:hypothetical protein n=1 Tax=Chitinophaga sp. S165 TaxID=2135462 RepID=UPI000D716CCB|nr:hypothetical protein [Chitinophaga sp. S165]PWV51545.1 hypothetical protein C7475_103154 [Chitinophaga sp. S165]